MGAPHYFGKVCAKHPELKGERRADRSCVACRRESNRKSQREWRAANPGAAGEKSRKWRAANPEKTRDNQRKWCAANLEKLREQKREQQRKWVAANPEKAREKHRKDNSKRCPEKMRESGRKYREANPVKVRANVAHRRALKRSATVPLTPEEKSRVINLYAEARRLTIETGERWEVDHDKPLARGGLHHPDNMMVIPAVMNTAKNARYVSTLSFILS